ncbi:MAG TPA: DUF1801 domain-containing protein [Actinophytocola sp.]|uniref:iron chaperone n=1 Tax=Actinophytocola sp. TaxID=1872138 RepID=UPI002DB72841|nr:DUF1801 domain-containing protein [Actinophytocola sp.]HEU5474569.1 DUF1801 domain-containing protein [Actinophytocola sp.]
MYGISDATTHDEYLDALPEPRRTDLRALHELIRGAVPELEPTMRFGIPAYGAYHYRYASGREGDSAVISFASNKRYVSLYVTGGPPGGYLAESYAPRLPNASVGKSCIRFRRLSDLDRDTLVSLFKEAVAHPPGDLI